jgi:cytochrome c peroxidase
VLNDAELKGLAIFQGKGRCINCHGGPETTNASFRNVINQRLEMMPMRDGGSRTYDNGFYNIGASPTLEDLGVGGSEPEVLQQPGRPLSESKLYALLGSGASSLLGNGFDPSKYAQPKIDEVSVNGAFKTPGLRNVELTGPYFHNGSKATLMQVVEHYNAGGGAAGALNGADLHPDIQPLNLEEEEKQNLVSFLLALTDNRVRMEKAPFDHPSLCIPNGHVDEALSTTQSGTTTNATDVMLCMKEVGAAGRATPISPFMKLSPYSR